MSDANVSVATPERPRPRRRHIGLYVLAVLLLGIAILILLWDWDWFIPLVEARASAALGRPVTIAHLHLRLGRVTRVAADDVTIANPAGFPPRPEFATADRLTVAINILDYIHGGRIVLPEIALRHPMVNAIALADGKNNWTLSSGPEKSEKNAGPPPRLGHLVVEDGHVHVVDPQLRADFNLTVATRSAGAAATAGGNAPAEHAAATPHTPAPSAPATSRTATTSTPTTSGPANSAASGPQSPIHPTPAGAGALSERVHTSQIVIEARGTYAGQPVTGRLIGGALLSLSDKALPYPVDLHAANGPTHIALVGSIRQPLALAGFALKLHLAGPDMSLLYPLTGIPIPQTPPFSVTGDLAYDRSGNKVQFHDMRGRVGSSDLNGNVDEAPGAARPDVVMDLYSHHVNLVDLGGFIGAQPGSGTQKTKAPAQSNGNLLPTTPFNLPKIKAADIHLHYRGEHIEGKYVPLDDLLVQLDVVDGRITLHPLNFGVGTGTIASNIVLDPVGKDIEVKADTQFRRINLSRIMQATHAFKGQGIIGGTAVLRTHGNSVATMMGNGNGELKLIMLGGGNVSALLVDLSGLEFGNALLSALGVPQRAEINCFVSDFALDDGIANTKVLLLDTTEARVTGKGTIDFRNQTLDYSLRTRAKHFSIGSLPGPIDITGKLASPAIRPGAEQIARAGAAVGLGIVLTPLGALLPTIQFGIGKDNACVKATAEEQAPMHIPPPSGPHRHRTR